MSALRHRAATSSYTTKASFGPFADLVCRGGKPTFVAIAKAAEHFAEAVIH